MAPKMRTTEECIERAVRIGREYIEVMRRDDPFMDCVPVRSLRYRLHNSGYACWLESVIVALEKEGLIKRHPSIDSLLYYTQPTEGALQKAREVKEREGDDVGSR